MRNLLLCFVVIVFLFFYISIRSLLGTCYVAVDRMPLRLPQFVQELSGELSKKVEKTKRQSLSKFSLLGVIAPAKEEAKKKQTLLEEDETEESYSKKPDLTFSLIRGKPTSEVDLLKVLDSLCEHIMVSSDVAEPAELIERMVWQELSSCPSHKHTLPARPPTSFYWTSSTSFTAL